MSGHPCKGFVGADYWKWPSTYELVDNENLKDKEIESSEIHLFGHNLKKEYGAKIIIFILYVVIILLCLSLLVLFFKFLYYYTKKEEIPKFEQLRNMTLENTSLPKDSTNITSIKNLTQVTMLINDKDVKNITQIQLQHLQQMRQIQNT